MTTAQKSMGSPSGLRRRAVPAALATLAALVGLAGVTGGRSAWAQDMPFLTMANDSATFLHNYMANEAIGGAALLQAERVAGRRPAPPARAVRASLAFGSDPAISRRVRQRFRDALMQAHPTERAAIDRALASDWLQGYREEIARPNGLDTRSLPDAFTAYLIASWALVHGQVQLPSAGIRAVRDRLREALASHPDAQTWSPAARQAAGEEAIHHTVLVMANRLQLHRQPDAQRQAAAARHYRTQVLQGTGIDLAQLALTPAGFVRRP